jgi:hypothetical protein
MNGETGILEKEPVSVDLESLEKMSEEFKEGSEKAQKIIRTCCRVLLNCRAYLDEDLIGHLKPYTE